MKPPPPPVLVQEGLLRRHSHACADSWELSLHSTTAGIALLSLHAWLQELQCVLRLPCLTSPAPCACACGRVCA